MANVTVGINSKFDAKGTRDATASLAELGKKVAEIGKNMSFMAFTKAMDIAKNAIGQIVDRIAILGKSLAAIKTAAMDILTPALNGVSALLTEKLPGITANIVAAMKVTKDIIQSITSGMNKVTEKERWTVFFSDLTMLSYQFGNVLGKLLENIFSNAPQFLIKGVLKVIPAIKSIINNIGIMLDTATRENQIRTRAAELAQKRYNPGGDKSYAQLEQEAMQEATAFVDNRIKDSLKKAGVELPTDFSIGSPDLQSALDELGKGLKGALFSLGDVFSGGGTAESFEKYKNEFLNSFASDTKGGDGNGGGGGGKSEDKKEWSIFNIFQEFEAGFRSFGEKSKSEFGDLAADFTDKLKPVTSTWGQVLKDTTANLQKEVSDAEVDMEYYLQMMTQAQNPEIAQAYSRKVAASIERITSATEKLQVLSKQVEYEANVAAAKTSIKDTVTQSGGDITAVAEGFATAGPLGALAAVIGKILEPLLAIENVGKVLNGVSTIFQKMADVLAPLINELLAPFVIILEIIGEIIGTVLAPVFEILINLLTPILNLVLTLLSVLKPIITVIMVIVSLFAEMHPVMLIFTLVLEAIASVFVWLYNTILLPIANGMIWVFNKIQEGFVWLYNKMSDVIKGITFGAVNLGQKTYNPMDELKEIVTAANTYDYTQTQEGAEASAASGTGSYTAEKDIIINIYFNNSYVNGDARQIALMLEQELKAAHGLGYGY
jgi:hypothetical protein